MSEPEAGSDLASLAHPAAVRERRSLRRQRPEDLDLNWGTGPKWCQLYVRTDPGTRRSTKGISCLILDMSLPGIEVRPLVTTGAAMRDFRGSVLQRRGGYLRDALLGPENGGWQIATTTLSHERAGAAPALHTEMQVRLGGIGPSDLADVQIGKPGPCSKTRRRCGTSGAKIAFAPSKYLEVLCQRSISRDPARWRRVSGRQVLAKTIWGEVGQSIGRVGPSTCSELTPNGRRWADYRP